MEMEEDMEIIMIIGRIIMASSSSKEVEREGIIRIIIIMMKVVVLTIKTFVKMEDKRTQTMTSRVKTSLPST